MCRSRKYTVPVVVLALIIVTAVGTLILENLSTSQYIHLQQHDYNAASYLAEAGVNMAYMQKLRPETVNDPPLRYYSTSDIGENGPYFEVQIAGKDENGDGEMDPVAELTSTGRVNDAYRVISQPYFYLPTNAKAKDSVLHITKIGEVKNDPNDELVLDYSGWENHGYSQHDKSTDTFSKYKEVTDYWGRKVNVLMFDRSPSGESNKDQTAIVVSYMNEDKPRPSLNIGDGVRSWELDGMSAEGEGGSISSWIKIAEPKEDYDDIGIIVQKGQIEEWHTSGNIKWGNVAYSLHYYKADNSTDPYVLQLMINSHNGTGNGDGIGGGNGNQVVAAHKRMGNDQWYHVLGTWGAKGMYLYINGEVAGACSYNGFVDYADIDDTDVYIGNQYLFADSATANDVLDFEGSMMEVMLLNRQIPDIQAEGLFLYRNIYYMFNGVGTSNDHPIGRAVGRALDSSVFLHHGYLFDEVAPSGVDRFNTPNSSYVFNGGGASVSPGAVDLGVDRSFTVMCWVKLSDLGAPGLVFYDAEKFSLKYDGAGGIVFDVFHSKRARLTADVGKCAAGWWHFAGVFDGSEMAVYINGQMQQPTLLRTGSFDSYSRSNPLFGGAVLGKNNLNSIKGMIDDFTVYSRRITDVELTEIVSEVKGVVWNFDNAVFADSNEDYPVGAAGVGATLDATTAVMGNSWSFNGSDSAYVVISPEIDFLEKFPFTVNVWVNTSSGGPVFAMHNSDWSKCYRIGVASDGKATATADDGSNSSSLTASAPLVNDDSWHMLTLVVAKLSFELYVDGVFTDKSEGVEFTPELIWEFGHFDDDNFSGNIDETTVFKRALTAGDVLNLYQWYQP